MLNLPYNEIALTNAVGRKVFGGVQEDSKYVTMSTWGSTVMAYHVVGEEDAQKVDQAVVDAHPNCKQHLEDKFVKYLPSYDFSHLSNLGRFFM